jgi:hypothetical protein
MTRSLTLNRTSAEWIAYFNENKQRLLSQPWGDDYRLTPREAGTILKSLQQFQLGESSEGNNLKAHAARYAERSGDSDYPAALQLFIQEEQRHASSLGRFMVQEHLMLAHANPVDSLFRIVRKVATFEMACIAMMTAEIIAMPYYTALHDATSSPLLRQICRQLLRDEVQHLRFQQDNLARLRQGRSALGMTVTRWVQRTLFALTLRIVWRDHQDVLKAGGLSAAKFRDVAWMRYYRTVGTRAIRAVNLPRYHGQAAR